MVGETCLASLRGKFHVGGMEWTVFTRVYLESCTWSVAIFMMDQRKEQWVCIAFCANIGKRATETIEMIQQGFGDKNVNRTQVFQWHASFKTGRTSVDDDEHTERPTSCTTPETVARIRELNRQDRRRTIRDFAEEVEVGYGTCQRVLTEELGMHLVAAKFVPRRLTADQKQQRVDVCTELRQLQFLAKNKIALIPNSPYSPDLAPCDFFLFPKMILKLKERRFDTIEEIKAEKQKVLDTLTENDFQEAFQKWRRRWDRCLHAGGNYFEGDDGR